MSGMRPFTVDAESTELTDGEVSEFAHLVQFLCHLPEQAKLTMWLSYISTPQPSSIQDFAQRQARAMWRTEVRC